MKDLYFFRFNIIENLLETFIALKIMTSCIKKYKNYSVRSLLSKNLRRTTE